MCHDTVKKCCNVVKNVVSLVENVANVVNNVATMTMVFGAHFCCQNNDCFTLCAKMSLNVVKNVMKRFSKCCDGVRKHCNDVKNVVNVVKNVVKPSVADPLEMH